jgi:hypothetical protein
MPSCTSPIVRRDICENRAPVAADKEEQSEEIAFPLLSGIHIAGCLDDLADFGVRDDLCRAEPGDVELKTG